MKIGDLELHLVSDGLVHVDPGGPFGLVPRPLYAPIVPLSDDNTMTMFLTCLLVRSRGKTILVDTGLGNKLTPGALRSWALERPTGGLIDGLARLGVEPGDVDIVIDTHLHSDHCGGNTIGTAEAPAAAFPRATYLVQRMEWADAAHPDARTRGTYFAENFQPLVREGRMRLLHGDTEVTDQVHCVVTPGHTRGHQSVRMRSGDWRGLYVADLASYAVHFERLAWMTAYDVEPLETLRTKRRWQAWAVDSGAWLFFEHDPVMSVGRLTQDGSRLRMQRVDEADELRTMLPTPQPLPGSPIE
jgi:glyoxylase-like metal-dependent hydrolase (beta-lactamase superfamily II)